MSAELTAEFLRRENCPTSQAHLQKSQATPRKTKVSTMVTAETEIRNWKGIITSRAQLQDSPATPRKTKVSAKLTAEMEIMN